MSGDYSDGEGRGGPDVDFVARVVTVGVATLADARAASLADAGMAFPADPTGIVTVHVGVTDLADAGMVTVHVGVTDLADAGMVTVHVGVTDLADAGMVTVHVGVTDLADAGMVTVHVGVTDLADARMVTVHVGVTDLADARAASLADAGMAFPADPAGVVTVGVASLADAGVVTVDVTDLADAGAASLAAPLVLLPTWWRTGMSQLPWKPMIYPCCRDVLFEMIRSVLIRNIVMRWWLVVI